MNKTESIKEYKAEGHTSKETAERFNVSADYVRRLCVGIAPQGYGPGRVKDDNDVADFISERIPGFEYVGSYTGCDGSANIKCKKCGAEFTRSMITIRKGNVRCRYCEQQRIKHKKEIKTAQRKERDQLREEKKREAERRAEEKKKKQIHNCPVCGQTTTRRVYCSESCARKASNKRGEVRRQRLISGALIDKDITVKGLFMRDAGRCYICGEQCNVNDFTINGNTFIAGNDYPSIDHVKPLNKGGVHSWDNVKLAHRRCNSLKSDKIVVK